jgi:hypothetical protein
LVSVDFHFSLARVSLTPVALEEGISDMTQSSKNWSRKLGLGIAVAMSGVNDSRTNRNHNFA